MADSSVGWTALLATGIWHVFESLVRLLFTSCFSSLSVTSARIAERMISAGFLYADLAGIVVMC
jgi:hypothetical protein